MDQTMVSAAAKLLQIPEEILASCLTAESIKGEEKWITLKDAADYAKVTPWTVRRWCTAHFIVWKKLNRARCGRIIIDRCSLQNFIMRCGE